MDKGPSRSPSCLPQIQRCCPSQKVPSPSTARQRHVRGSSAAAVHSPHPTGHRFRPHLLSESATEGGECGHHCRVQPDRCGQFSRKMCMRPPVTAPTHLSHISAMCVSAQKALGGQMTVLGEAGTRPQVLRHSRNFQLHIMVCPPQTRQGSTAPSAVGSRYEVWGNPS